MKDKNELKNESKEKIEEENIQSVSEQETQDNTDANREKANEEHVERIRELEEKNKELNDRLLRRLAEFENYKKRSDAEKLSLLEYAGEKLVLKIIPVYDDLQRSLLHIEDEKNIQAIKDGLQMVLDKFTKVFEEIGIKKMETKGKEFDFNFHEALLQQPADNIPANTVIDEVEPGYFYKDKVIKHAKVIVSQEVN
ncbi:MAG: nucleotide exchange factor GrpE [Ignavibacteriales bacterium CG_4_9_14_3_um_filter_34_10]|nr:MAG: nucleotide exchange factor GrpE [Ignavibacteriales bacterium CG_4_9_14_3_um_filter_34_10]